MSITYKCLYFADILPYNPTILAAVKAQPKNIRQCYIPFESVYLSETFYIERYYVGPIVVDISWPYDRWCGHSENFLLSCQHPFVDSPVLRNVGGHNAAVIGRIALCDTAY